MASRHGAEFDAHTTPLIPAPTLVLGVSPATVFADGRTGSFSATRRRF
jgi:hypothetical protein